MFERDTATWVLVVLVFTLCTVVVMGRMQGNITIVNDNMGTVDRLTYQVSDLNEQLIVCEEKTTAICECNCPDNTLNLWVFFFGGIVGLLIALYFLFVIWPGLRGRIEQKVKEEIKKEKT